MREQYLKTIKSASRFGFIASMVVVVFTIMWMWVSPYTFRQSDRVMAIMLVAVCLLAIVNMSIVLLSVRNRFAKIRRLETLEERLQQYSAVVARNYYVTFVIILVCCFFTVLSGKNEMLMLVLVLSLTLFMAFPNMYRMKVDMGLTNEQAKELWGDEYIFSDEERAEMSVSVKDDEEKGDATSSAEKSDSAEK